MYIWTNLSIIVIFILIKVLVIRCSKDRKTLWKFKFKKMYIQTNLSIIAKFILKCYICSYKSSCFTNKNVNTRWLIPNVLIIVFRLQYMSDRAAGRTYKKLRPRVSEKLCNIELYNLGLCFVYRYLFKLSVISIFIQVFIKSCLETTNLIVLLTFSAGLCFHVFCWSHHHLEHDGRHR